MEASKSFKASQSQRVRAAALLVCVGLISLGHRQTASAGTAKVDVVGLTAKEAEAGLRSGAYTSVDLVKSFQDRIAKYEPYYNAFVSYNPDALADAAALDAELKSSGPRSPLHGVPIVIKEAMDVKGLPSTAGWAPFSSQAGGVDLIPEKDAVVVAKLRAAGAVILGKTNIPAFSFSGTNANNSWAGPTYNAYGPFAPGGSSAGTATAVALSFAVLGTAEETGGSIQNPAAAQSLVGVKPTFGLTPTVGVNPLTTQTRDVVGPHAKTVYDAAIAMDIMAGYTPDDPRTAAAIGKVPAGGYTSKLSETALDGKRFGLIGPGWRTGLTLTPETQALYDKSIADLKAQGATVVADPFAGSSFASLISVAPPGFQEVPYDFDQYLKNLGSSAAYNSVAEAGAGTGRNPFGPGEPLEYIGTAFPEAVADPTVNPDLSSFFASRESLLAELSMVMDANDLDGLFFPQMLAETPSIFSPDQIAAATVSEINLLGTPGVTVAAGYYESGAPYSAMFLGENWTEADLLGFAYDFEQATLARVEPQAVPLPPAVWMGFATMAGGLVITRLRRQNAA